MERVAVIGCGGSGKSTLSRMLSEVTGLPVVHLDSLFWSAGWVEPDRTIWQRQVSEIVSRPRWIIDGNYGGTQDLVLAAADTVILLDMPRYLCVYRVIRRWLTHYGRTRPDMAPGCHEHVSLKFMMWVYGYRKHRLPTVLHRIAMYAPHAACIRLYTAAEVGEFVYAVHGRDKPSVTEA